jgi:hypothetical protein
MAVMETDEDLLPGFVERDEWARRAKRHPGTVKRWEDKGLIVVRYVGRLAFVDTAATAARMRGEDRPSRRKAG